MRQNGNARLVCPICTDQVDKLLFRYHIENEREVLQKLKMENPEWVERDGVCSRCVDHYQTEIIIAGRMLPTIGPFFPVRTADDFVILPTPLRLDSDPRFTGKGVTICFIDSGFSAHPDLVVSKQRIKAYLDITIDDSLLPIDNIPVNNSSWHGTMTTVICAGDGYLSRGLYKGIASEAELVLLKVQDNDNKITTQSLVKALQWVLANYEKFGIRIVNMSVSADEELSAYESEVDTLAEMLIEKGVLVVAAVGNNEHAAIKPPANAMNVIAVGGVDDGNQLETSDMRLYHSTYGATIDGFYKPELITNAIWLAAPILPGTMEHQVASVLQNLLMQNQVISAADFSKSLSAIGIETSLDFSESQLIDGIYRETFLKRRIQETKYFSSDYMHVDGTSFAAPIVCAVIAQLFELVPTLSAKQIREVLFKTAKRFPSLPAIRQGFGSIHPRQAVFEVLKREVLVTVMHDSPYINKFQNSIEFYIQHDSAHQISLVGSFNSWTPDVLLMQPSQNGIWKIEIPLLPMGKYQYKFLIDSTMWVEDVGNSLREPDGLSGWNSVFLIQ